MVLLYPRLVATVSAGLMPDRLLLLAAGAIAAPVLLMTGVYTAFGPLLVRVTFGEQYLGAAPLLGAMGVAMVGYGLVALWLNAWLATRPGPFVLLLLAAAILQHLLLALFHESLAQVVAIFAGGGWLVVAAGTLLYLMWLRPRLKQEVQVNGRIR